MPCLEQIVKRLISFNKGLFLQNSPFPFSLIISTSPKNLGLSAQALGIISNGKVALSKSSKLLNKVY